MKTTTNETQRWWLETHGYRRKIINDKKLSCTVEVYINEETGHVMRTSTFDRKNDPIYNAWVNEKLVKLRERLQKKVREHVENIQASSN